ncbi:MAG: PTS sugar transporter subunit IIA [Treponema sp.]|nr:PTS sugar transporter subunit IIA [Treponema sp.]MCL2272512.1 PTS sugar transporter subunit IIA [Treponema sp.]
MNSEKNESLAQLLMRGGIYYNVPGGAQKEVLLNLVNMLPALSAEKSEALFNAVMEREALMSTGVENGIALPHPRTPMLDEKDDPFIAIAFPAKSPDWQTPDGSEVHTIFLIVSKSPKQHLCVLSKINFLCQQEEFLKLITAQSSEQLIISTIEKMEKKWE